MTSDYQPGQPGQVASALLGLGTGAVLGTLLEKSKLSTPSSIINFFFMHDFTAMRVFLSAIAASSATISVMQCYGQETYPKPLVPRANMIGGLIGGVGLALSGLCPDSLFSQFGSGRPEALPSLLGAFTGTIVYIYAYPYFQKALEREKKGTPQLHQTLGLTFTSASAGLIAATIATLAVTERLKPSAHSTLSSIATLDMSAPSWSPYVCGALIGALQIPTFLVMQTYVGSSAAYVTAASHACSLCDRNLFARNKYAAVFQSGAVVVWELALHVGCFLGARLSASLSGTLQQNGVVALTSGQRVQAFVGSALLLFGMRLAGGCTSGHGVSGVSQLSVSSLLATMSFVVGGASCALISRCLRV